MNEDWINSMLPTLKRREYENGARARVLYDAVECWKYMH